MTIFPRVPPRPVLERFPVSLWAQAPPPPLGRGDVGLITHFLRGLGAEWLCGGFESRPLALVAGPGCGAGQGAFAGSSPRRGVAANLGRHHGGLPGGVSSCSAGSGSWGAIVRKGAWGAGQDEGVGAGQSPGSAGRRIWDLMGPGVCLLGGCPRAGRWRGSGLCLRAPARWCLSRLGAKVRGCAVPLGARCLASLLPRPSVGPWPPGRRVNPGGAREPRPSRRDRVARGGKGTVARERD